MMDWLVRATCRAQVQTVEEIPEGVQLRYAVWLPALAGRLSGFAHAAAAVTLGRTIVVHPSARITRELVQHELAHVRQWQANPFTFPLRYVLNHVRYGYDDNPYEVEARAAENTRSVQ